MIFHPLLKDMTIYKLFLKFLKQVKIQLSCKGNYILTLMEFFSLDSNEFLEKLKICFLKRMWIFKCFAVFCN